MEECVLRVSEQAVPTHQTSPDSIISLSYVIRFNALPGIETEIPVLITSLGYRNAASAHAQQRNGQAVKERRKRSEGALAGEEGKRMVGTRDDA